MLYYHFTPSVALDSSCACFRDIWLKRILYNHKPISMPKLSVTSLQMADDSNPMSYDVILFQKHSCVLIFQYNSKHKFLAWAIGISPWIHSAWWDASRCLLKPLRAKLLVCILMKFYSTVRNWLFPLFTTKHTSTKSSPPDFLLWVQFHFFPFLVPLGPLWLPQPAQCQYHHWSCALRSTAQQRPSAEHGEVHLPPRGYPTTATSAWGLWRRARRRQCLVACSAGENSKRPAYTHFNHTAKTAGEADSDTYCQEYAVHTYSVGPQLTGIKAAASNAQSRKLHHTHNTSPSIAKGNFVPSSIMMKRMR